jgi:diaminopimelate decarboxylase
MEDMETAVKAAVALANIEFIGLHFHIGSQILEMGDFEALAKRINELQDRLEEQGIKVQNINVGGGLGIAYDDPDGKPIPDFKKYFDTYAKNLQLREGQQMHFELGRAVVGQMGSLITRVLYVKHAHVKQFAIVDAGMSDLIRPALYDAHHEIQNLTSTEAEETYDVVGPLCESSDVFGKDEKLPACHRGDLIALRSAGAYGEIMACQYNCRKLPKAYLM